MKLWSFELKITRRDKVLKEIDEVLSNVGVNSFNELDGVRRLAAYFRNADRVARQAVRRADELERSIVDYEAALLRAQAVERASTVDSQSQPTPIEQAARYSSGVDMPHTQQSPVYRPSDTGPHEMPVLEGPAHKTDRSV